MAQVKKFSPSFFEACDWIKANTMENATFYTVWSHGAVYNCQRNAIGTSTVPDMALSRDANYTIKVAKENGITHFFIQKFSIDLQNRHLGERYDAELVQFLENNPEYFEKYMRMARHYNSAYNKVTVMVILFTQLTQWV